MINPYSDPEKAGLLMLCFECTACDYDYNMWCFWVDRSTGFLYTGFDAGDSTDAPFECYEQETALEVLQRLERQPDLSGVVTSLDGWDGKLKYGRTGSIFQIEDFYRKHALPIENRLKAQQEKKLGKSGRVLRSLGI